MPIHPSITPSAPHSPITSVQQRTASHDDPRNRLYNASSFQRAPGDFYPTPPDLTRGLIDGLTKISRDDFMGVFFVQCLDEIGCHTFRLREP